MLQDAALAGPRRRHFGRIAQLVEQLTLNQRVPGSSPGAPTNKFNHLVEPVAEEKLAHITPHHLAALSLCRGAEALERAASDHTTWFFVILYLHRALHCALIAALWGTAGIGAYPEKEQARWYEYFNKFDEPDAEEPKSDYLPYFPELLSMAKNGSPHMLGPPLQLTPEQNADIAMLNEFRGNLEHVKPGFWFLEVSGMPRICSTVAGTFAALLKSFGHRLDEGDLEQVQAAISTLKQTGCSTSQQFRTQ